MAVIEVVNVLRRFATKEASTDAAMRALAEHAGWFVPATLVPGEHVMFEKLVVLGSEGRAPERLWLFTDEQRAHIASGNGFAMGVYGGPLTGDRVFELLDERFPEVDVNPGSPRDETWNMGRAAYPLAKAWGTAIALERSFHGDPTDMTRRLAAYDDYLLLVASDNTLVRLPVGPDDAQFGMVFTTPDWRDALLAQLSDDQRANVRSVSMRGRDLFGELDRLGVQGLVLNITAPESAQLVLPIEAAQLVGKL